MHFKAKLYLQLRWYDKRLTYENLKENNDEKNSIGKIIIYLTLLLGSNLFLIQLKCNFCTDIHASPATECNANIKRQVAQDITCFKHIIIYWWILF